MKIAILGGSFNPPHQGHICITKEAKRLMNFDQIWWEPTKQNPFKKEKNTDISYRIQKCIKITQDYDYIIVKDHERSVEKSISINLVRKIIKLYPEHQFYWLMGADSIIDFHLWEGWKEIIELMNLVICNRDGYFFKARKSEAYLYAKNCNKCSFLRINKLNISSTQIRNEL